MDLQLKITGILLISIAIIHAIFPKYFNWKKELSTVSMINRQLMYVHSFFIAFALMLIGLLCLTSTGEILHTGLGRRISLGIAVFWFVRLIVQFFVYSPALWKGKKFETFVHLLLSIIWIYLSIVFFAAYAGF